MRLLTVGSLPPEWGGPLRGGVATFHAALLTELLKRENEVELVGTLPPTALDREVPVPVWTRPEESNRARFYEETLERLRPDVVLMNHIAHTIGVTHARLGSPAPAVGVVHSWHSVTFRSGAEREHAVELNREALGGLRTMVVPSHHAMAEGRRLGFEYPAHSLTIHNPVPPLYMDSGMDGPDLPAADRHGVLYLGSLIRRKQPDALVDAAANIPGLQVTLVGEGELEAELRRKIGEMALGSRVRLQELPAGEGHLPRVRELMLGAQAMCLPSLSEGLPLAFLEALACGTPIVGFGSVVREIRDEVGIEVGEPIDSDTPEEIAAAIESVLATDWDRDQLRRATLDRFGLDRVTDRYLELFSQIADDSDYPAPTSETSETPSHGAAPAAQTSATPSHGAAPAPRFAVSESTAVCVLGMSRSGTSLAARILNLAGVYLGTDQDLLGGDLRHLAGEGEEVIARAREANPEGFWEHYRLMRLNEQIFRKLGGSWREPPDLPLGWENSDRLAPEREQALALISETFAGRELWGWKDPRNCLTLPFWQNLLPRLRYVICLRNPIEVASSLERRDGIPPATGVELWSAYVAAALVNTSGRPRIFVRYGDHFEDPVATAVRLARFAGWEAATDSPDAEALLGGVVDDRLWRNRSTAAEVVSSEAASAPARSLYLITELLAAASTDRPSRRLAELNAAADRYAESFLGRNRSGWRNGSG